MDLCDCVHHKLNLKGHQHSPVHICIYTCMYYNYAGCIVLHTAMFCFHCMQIWLLLCIINPEIGYPGVFRHVKHMHVITYDTSLVQIKPMLSI